MFMSGFFRRRSCLHLRIFAYSVFFRTILRFRIFRRIGILIAAIRPYGITAGHTVVFRLRLGCAGCRRIIIMFMSGFFRRRSCLHLRIFAYSVFFRTILRFRIFRRIGILIAAIRPSGITVGHTFFFRLLAGCAGCRSIIISETCSFLSESYYVVKVFHISILLKYYFFFYLISMFS